MKVYIKPVKIYCEQCGGRLSIDNEWRLNGPYPDGGGLADSPQHCDADADCPGAIKIKNGGFIGVWLGNPLTNAGVEYVQWAISCGGTLAELWAECYKSELAQKVTT